MLQTQRQQPSDENAAAKWIEAMKRRSSEEDTDRDLSWPEADGKSAVQWAAEANVVPRIQVQALAEVLELPFWEDLGNVDPSTTFVERIPISFARQHQLLGLEGPDNQVRVAFSNRESWHLLDVVRRRIGRWIDPILAPPDQILSAINDAYQKRVGQAQTAIDALGPINAKASGELISKEDLLEEVGRAPVVDVVNKILFEAVKVYASDLHLQPYEDRVVVRLRIDGVLFDAFELPKTIQEEAISRVKVMGQMNIAEKRLAQDGRASVQVGDRQIDLRIASLPTSFGERVVIRLLDKSARIYTLSELGMHAETFSHFRQLIGLEHGLILVTGPTGSGKSTTLYAALQQINSKDRNVVTLEDPIEYQLEGISQTQVNLKKGMTFASGLRNVLRQDPDIIMVGEIRDQETAVMAIQSALTGHLVFSTLHTNDAAGAVTRLLDLGIEPYLVASSVVAVMAQRLVRKVCDLCAKQVLVERSVLERIVLKGVEMDEKQTLLQGTGCDLCRHTGYRGRIGIFELLVIDDSIRDQIQNQANASRIREVAVQNGMRLLREDGLARILEGRTTVEEVVRVTMRTSL